jgi:hypothetical protein
MRSEKRLWAGWSSKATWAAVIRRAQAHERAELQGGGAVARHRQPGLRLLAVRVPAQGGHRQRLHRPLVALLVALRPGVGHHAVGRLVQRGGARVVAQHGQQRLLQG